MSEEEIYKMLLTENIEKFPLLNEIFAIRNNKFKINDYTIYVTGCISLDVINRAIEKVNYIDKLQKENEELQKCLEAEEKYSEGLNGDIKSLLNIEPNTNFISKDKIREKIKELNKNIELQWVTTNYNERVSTTNNTIEVYKYQYATEVLKELLGDE